MVFIVRGCIVLFFHSKKTAGAKKTFSGFGNHISREYPSAERSFDFSNAETDLDRTDFQVTVGVMV
jgi:hypothetical protein